MALSITAALDLSIWRNDDVFEFPLRIVGPDLTGVAMRAQVRLERDTPGAALVALETVTNGNAEGIRHADAPLVDGRYENDVRIRINKSTRQALPYAGELGDPAVLRWAFAIAGVTRIEGRVFVLAHAIDSDDAPTDRPASYGYGSQQSGVPQSGATLTISEDGGATLVVDGADQLGALVVLSQDAADRAETAAGQVEDLRGVVFGLAAPRITSFTANPQLVEVGSTAAVALAWSVSTAPTTQTLDDVPIGPMARAAQLAGPWNADRTSTVTVTDDHGSSNSASVTIYKRTPIFAGLCAGEAPTDAEIRGAQYKRLDSTAIARSLTLDRSTGGRPFFVFPAGLTLASIRLGGFAVTGWTTSAPFDLVLGTNATVSMRRVVLDPLPASTSPLGADLA